MPVSKVLPKMSPKIRISPLQGELNKVFFDWITIESSENLGRLFKNIGNMVKREILPDGTILTEISDLNGVIKEKRIVGKTSSSFVYYDKDSNAVLELSRSKTARGIETTIVSLLDNCASLVKKLNGKIVSKELLN